MTLQKKSGSLRKSTTGTWKSIKESPKRRPRRLRRSDRSIWQISKPRLKRKKKNMLSSVVWSSRLWRLIIRKKKRKCRRPTTRIWRRRSV